MNLEPEIGSLFAGRFRIRGLLGRGGMGSVYLAQHENLRRPVALKLLSPQLLANLNVMGRFQREARAASRMVHPHITQVYDFGHSEDGVPYLVMEYVEGTALLNVLVQDGAFPVPRALHVLGQVARALIAAHEADVVHRDLKTNNIVLTSFRGEDFVKLLDFGLAKILGPEATASLSAQGILFGTPEYMSPEQISGTEVDFRVDIYSFGILAFELLTGEVPFKGTAMEIMAAHVNREAPPLSASGDHEPVPGAVQALVRRCLAKRPDDRPGTAALAEEVEALARCATTCATLLDFRPG
jgi:eukaryotic-like serine/threonine-protein kinase